MTDRPGCNSPARAVVVMYKLVLIATVLVGLLCFVATASARTLSARPSGGGLVENPDGTWSLWGEGSDTKPLRTYSPEEHLRMEKENKALELEVGNGDNPLTEIEGITARERAAAEDLGNKLKTGEPYKSVAEQTVGEDVAAEAESAGTLPSWADTLGALADAGGVVAGAGAAAYVGVEVGNGIDRLVGWPQLDLGELFGETLPERCNGEHGPFCEEFREHMQWQRKLRLDSKLTCKEAQEKAKVTVTYTTQKCIAIEGYLAWTQEEVAHENEYVYDKTGWEGTFSEDPLRIIEPCNPAGKLVHGVCLVESYDEKKGQATANYYEIQRHPAQCKTKSPDVRLCPGDFTEAAFPTTGLKAHNKGIEEGGPATVPRPEPLTAPVKPSGPEVAPLPVVTYIVHEREPEFPGVPETDEPEEKEEKRPIPDPLWPELPKPERSEVGTHYKERVEGEGFNDVEIQELPETKTDPKVGPEEVSKVEPEPGNKYDPKTKITVVVNPPGAAPGESGSIPKINIGGIDEPELKPPHLDVLCEKFPFGVPCWLLEELKSWSAVGSPPTLGISSFSIKGHTIPGASVDLSPLEPIMEKVRPVMVVLGTVGLVLLFYSFATGGNAGAGSGGGSSGSEEDDDV